MTPEQHTQLIEEIRTHTAEVIKTTVNGKIDKIDKKMDELKTSYDDHAQQDAVWQETANPVIKGANNLIGASKLVVAFVAGLSVILGAGTLIYKTFF